MVLRLVALAAALALLVPGAGLPAASGGAELAYVTVEDTDELVAVDPYSSTVTARLRVPRGPHNLAVSSDRRYLLLTSPPAGAVTLVDAFPPAEVLKVFRGLRSPHDVAFAPDGRYAYVTEERGGTVAVLSLTTRRIVRRVSVGAGPHDLAVRPDGRRVWVTHGPASRLITILWTDRPAHATVAGHVGSLPAHDIAFTRNGLFVWVTYWGSAGLVGKIRAYERTGRLRLHQFVGALVHHVEVDAGGRLWATDHAAGKVQRLSGWSGRPLFGFGGCPGTHHVAIGPGHGYVSAACHDAGMLAIYDPETKRVARVSVGSGPHGVAVAFVP